MSINLLITQLIWSDNGLNFKLAHKTLQEIAQKAQKDQQDDVQTYCSNHMINWHFITELSPWKGGMWERMIGLLKKILRRSFGRSRVTIETFETFLAEAEAILNSRPLTRLSDNVNDPFTVIHPIDFIQPYAKLGTEILEEDFQDPEYFNKLEPSTKLLKIWQSSQQYLDKCWEIFFSEYLSTLQERYQHMHKQGKSVAQETPKEGAVVVVNDEQKPRGYWKLGQIIQLKYRNDNQISSAMVRMPNGTVLNRPISLLYPLEIDTEVTKNNKLDSETEESKNKTSVSRRITRSMTKDQRNVKSSTNMLSTLSKKITLTLIFLPLMIQFSMAKECALDSQENMTTIFSEECISYGFVLKKNKKGSVCWIHKNCNKLHLHNDGNCKQNVHVLNGLKNVHMLKHLKMNSKI